MNTASKRNKSKKRSDGSNQGQLSLDDFVLYLDENLDNCKPIVDVLYELGIHYERHQAYYARGTDDDVWLPEVGKNGWCVLTKDKRNRYNDLEKQKVVSCGVREFYFSSGNWSGADMALALTIALPVMRRTMEAHDPPFVASITKNGDVTVLFDKDGSTHERRQASRKAREAAKAASAVSGRIEGVSGNPTGKEEA